MAQRPKETVRRAILDATVMELAHRGYEGTTLAGVADRAGTSVGNVYRYFANKDELYRSAVPHELTVEVARLVTARVEAFGDARDVSRLGREHAYFRVVGALTELSLAHRPHLLFLLARSEGSPHHGYADARVRDLTKAALAYLARTSPTLRPTAADRRALTRLYQAFVAGLATTLREETKPEALERAIGLLTTYHLAGLRAFFDALTRASEERP